jgi:proline iminopeptidase
MASVAWREHRLNTPDVALAWYEAGEGRPVVFVNGGPGDDHRYLRLLAAPLTASVRCVLYDQRGTGGSRVARLDAATLHVARHCADIDALRARLGVERVALVGHSWGATLALLYGTLYPERVARLALIAPGPLRAELDVVAEANILQPLSAAEREEYRRLRARRREALAAGDLDTCREIHLRLVTGLMLRSLVYAPEAAARFAAAFRAGYAHNSLMNRLTTASLDRERLWDELPRVTAPALILYGRQDFEPIAQAYELRERLPQLEIRLINECGHVPWLDQPEAVTRELLRFLGA